MKQWATKQTGFTIVELLIVIVVIAILAAITIVSYNGIQNRANDTAVKSDIRNFAMKIMQFQAEKGYLPAGNTRDLPEGMTQFALNKGAYDTTVHNFFYCRGVVDGKEVYGVGAQAKSGTRFAYTSNGGATTLTSGGWGGNTAACPALGVPTTATEYSYSYAWNASDKAWNTWTQ